MGGRQEGLKIRRADSHTLSLLVISKAGGEKRLGCMLFAGSLSLLLLCSISVLTYPVSVTVGLCGLGLCDQLEQ